MSKTQVVPKLGPELRLATDAKVALHAKDVMGDEVQSAREVFAEAVPRLRAAAARGEDHGEIDIAESDVVGPFLVRGQAAVLRVLCADAGIKTEISSRYAGHARGQYFLTLRW
jgi:hypothetical protein